MKRQIAKTVIFILIFVMLLTLVTTFFKITDSVSLVNIKGFRKEPENSLDVVCVGASEVYSGFSAIRAYEEYGFTSYSMGVAGIPAGIYKSMINEVYKTQNPKVLVIEVNGFLRGDKYLNRKGKIHCWYDNIPWSLDKAASILDGIKREEQGEYFFPLSAYHNNWKNIPDCIETIKDRINMYSMSITDLKGFATFAETFGYDEDELDFDNGLQLTETCEGMFRDLVDYLKEQGIENVLFARFPHACYGDEEPFEIMEEICEDAGYDFINLQSEYDLLDLDTAEDFYNDDHLNVYGMEKMTNYLGEYITERYHLDPEHDEETIRSWDNSAKVADSIIDLAKSKTKKDTGERIYEMTLFR